MRTDRLLLLADYLEQPWGSEYAGEPLRALPVLFPGSWAYDATGQPVHLTGGKMHYVALDGAKMFFRLPWAVVGHLFVPGAQLPLQFGGEHLPLAVPAGQVAKQIRSYLKQEKRYGRHKKVASPG